MFRCTKRFTTNVKCIDHIQFVVGGALELILVENAARLFGRLFDDAVHSFPPMPVRRQSPALVRMYQPVSLFSSSFSSVETRLSASHLFFPIGSDSNQLTRVTRRDATGVTTENSIPYA